MNRLSIPDAPSLFSRRPVGAFGAQVSCKAGQPEVFDVFAACEPGSSDREVRQAGALPGIDVVDVFRCFDGNLRNHPLSEGLCETQQRLTQLPKTE